MPKFMLLLGGTGSQAPVADLPYPEIMTKYREWTEELAKAGQLVLAHKLFNGEGHSLLAAGKGAVKDGPFAETKETVGGFYLIEAPDYDAAVAAGRRSPQVLYLGGWVQVRRVEL